MRRSGYIPAALYKKILAVMPIPCVDAVIVHRGTFLLGKRKNRPAQGKWWFVGGWVRKGERLEQAVRRHVKAETGNTKVKIGKLVTTKGTIFKDSAQGPASHTVNTVFLVTVPGKAFAGRASAENSEFKWFSKAERGLPPYVREVLRLSGFK